MKTFILKSIFVCCVSGAIALIFLFAYIALVIVENRMYTETTYILKQDYCYAVDNLYRSLYINYSTDSTQDKMWNDWMMVKKDCADYVMPWNKEVDALKIRSK